VQRIKLQDVVASIRRDPFVTRLLIGAVGVTALVVLATSSVRAAAVPTIHCQLPRAPSLSELRAAKDADCSLDEDGNGVDDVVERALAACIVPAVVLDSAENALGPGDPVVVFSARPLGTNLIRFRYVFLFVRDTGYLFGTDFPCLKYEHNGDLQVVEVDAVWTEHNREWFGVPIAIHASTVHDLAGITLSGEPSASFALSGTHPILYSTAGKHHWSYRATTIAYGCDCGPFGRCGSVRERADGRGPRVIPTFVGHAPGFYMERRSIADAPTTPEFRVLPQSPLTDDGRRFSNTCEFRKHGRIVPASSSFLTNDLGDLGYAGEVIYGPCFRGGLGGPCLLTEPIADSLAWNEPFASSIEAGKLISWLLGTAGKLGSPDESAPGWFTLRPKTVPIKFSAIVEKSRLFVGP
jgi:hypothetical protein